MSFDGDDVAPFFQEFGEGGEREVFRAFGFVEADFDLFFFESLERFGHHFLAIEKEGKPIVIVNRESDSAFVGSGWNFEFPADEEGRVLPLHRVEDSAVVTIAVTKSSGTSQPAFFFGIETQLGPSIGFGALASRRDSPTPHGER